MKIGIVGLGLMGGSIAKALNHKHEIIAYDISNEALTYALNHQIIQEGYTNLEAFFHETSIIYLCLYPQMIASFIKNNQKYMQKGSVIIEISGIKTSIIEDTLPFINDDIDVVFTHPIAGREKKGVNFAKETIFHNANYVIVPTTKNKEASIELTKELAHEMKFKNISIISKEEHDDIIAYTSQLTHVLSLTLVNSDPETYDTFRFIGDSYRDLTRIAMINEDLWSELFLENKNYLLPKIDSFIENLTYYRKLIVDNDIEKLKEIMKEAKNRRLKIESGGKE
jgi:prephenate dehydrogenase